MSKRKDKTDSREVRTITMPVELREDDDGTAHLVGYAAVFNSRADLGWFTEEIEPGAFRETIADDDIVALVSHNPQTILGRKRAKTLALREDDKGLFIDITLPDTQHGRDIRESVRRGDIDGQSFGFDTLDDEWRTEDGKEHRILKRVKLYDVGPTPFPAYPDTSVAVRSRDRWREEHDDDTATPEAERRETENTPSGSVDALAHLQRIQRHAEALGA